MIEEATTPAGDAEIRKPAKWRKTVESNPFLMLCLAQQWKEAAQQAPNREALSLIPALKFIMAACNKGRNWLSDERIGEEIRVSGSELVRRFRRAFGIPVGNFYKAARLQVACNMLQNGSSGIEVAAFLNMEDPSGGKFSSWFSHQMGVNVREWLAANPPKEDEED